MSQIKVCKDCAFYRLASWPPHVCESPSVAKRRTNYVTGQEYFLIVDAVVAREPVSGACGPTARHFQAKPPSWWRRLVAKIGGGAQ